MTDLIMILALLLFGLTLAALAVIVVGIHRDERAKTLTRHPHSAVQANTRRVLGVGVRSAQSDGKGE